jgi:hypothetical protein
MWNSGRGDGQVDNAYGKRKLRIVWGSHRREMRCNGAEVMWSEVAKVVGDDKERCNRWDSEWRIGLREKNL